MKNIPPYIFMPSHSSDRIRALVLLESEVEQISSCLTYLADRAGKISLNTAGLSEQTDGDVSLILNEITASTKSLSGEALNVRFAVEAAHSIIIAQLENAISGSHD